MAVQVDGGKPETGTPGKLQAWRPHAGTCLYWSCSHGERRQPRRAWWHVWPGSEGGGRGDRQERKAEGKCGQPASACAVWHVCSTFFPFFYLMVDFFEANSFIVWLQIVVPDVRAATGPNLGRIYCFCFSIYSILFDLVKY